MAVRIHVQVLMPTATTAMCGVSGQQRHKTIKSQPISDLSLHTIIRLIGFGSMHGRKGNLRSSRRLSTEILPREGTA